jgi:photosystem II stability/assembly factor-like uncharacterized protein
MINTAVSQIHQLYAQNGNKGLQELCDQLRSRSTNSEFSELTHTLSKIACLEAEVTVTKIPVNTTASLRGLQVVNDSVIWASGTQGTFLKSTNGGISWDVGQVAGAEELDFRDVVAFDENNAVLLSIGPGESSRIYRTFDSGMNWSLQYQGDCSEVFLDSVSFWDSEHGVAMGDPINGKFFLLETTDGLSWYPIHVDNLPSVIKGEQAFAASGTCLKTTGNSGIWLVSGGSNARIYYSDDKGKSWSIVAPPFICGEQSQGIFSIAFANEGVGVVVGGDYLNPDNADKNVAISCDGELWRMTSGLTGYRSCVSFVDSRTVIAVGSSGADISVDCGQTWRSFSHDSFNTVSSKGLNSTFVVGKEGGVYKLQLTYSFTDNN